MPRLQSVLRSGREAAVLCPHPIPLEVRSGSLMFPPPAPTIGSERLPGKVVRRDHEHAIRLGVRDIDNSQVPARSCLTQSNPRTLAARPVFTGSLQKIKILVRCHLMVMNMG